jgi:hypothetical protein
MKQRRRLIFIGSVAAVLGAAVLAYGMLTRSPTPGPLQPTDLVQSFGTYAEDGSTLSLVVELRGEVPVVATLRSVTLADPDKGLSIVGSGILDTAFSGYVVKSFPPGPMTPVAGTVVTTKPGDPSGDVFIVLGIKTDLAGHPQSMRGVWLDYSVDGVIHRALLPWLLRVCPEPGSDACEFQPEDQFVFPAPDS